MITWLHISYTKSSNADALYLNAYNRLGKEIFTWSCHLHQPVEVDKKAENTPAITIKDENNIFSVTCDNITYHFDKSTGFVHNVNNGKKDISFSNGPMLAGVQQSLTDRSAL